MLKKELVAEVVRATGLNFRQADECVASVVEQVTNALARGEPMNIMGFGRFSLQHVAKRQGRHPQTGAPLVIAPHNKVSFKAGSHFKQAIQKDMQND